MQSSDILSSSDDKVRRWVQAKYTHVVRITSKEVDAVEKGGCTTRMKWLYNPIKANPEEEKQF